MRLVVDPKKINNLKSDDFVNKNQSVSTRNDAVQHMAWQGKKIFFLQVSLLSSRPLPANGRPKVHRDASIQFREQNISLSRLAQGLSRALSDFSSFMRESLDKVIKCDQCTQYVDDVGIAANFFKQVIKNLRATFECNERAGLKLTMRVIWSNGN